ncbi:MAG: hypothetical protein C4290_10570 [Chloroflexota bacterium]
MSVAALPFAAFLVFLEFAAGTQVILLIPQARGQVSPGFLKMGAVMAFAGAALALWTTAALPAGDEVAGYRLDPSFLGPMRAVMAVFALLSLATLLFVFREDGRRGRALNAAASAAALVALALAAAVLRLPTWGYPGALLALVAGAASLGAVSLGMTLGHWYLVTPRLPEKPLNELTLVLLGCVATQTLVVAINAVLPVREVPVSADVAATSLLANLWFWLRLLVGLLFPLGLAYMAWQSSVVRAMMSATGLLYIALGAVLAGEIVARALLFTTAKPL